MEKILDVIIERTSIDKGLTLEALASIVFGDANPLSIHKTQTAIQWIKMTTLETMLEKGISGPITICKVNDIIFNCTNSEQNKKYLINALECHGLRTPDKSMSYITI